MKNILDAWGNDWKNDSLLRMITYISLGYLVFLIFFLMFARNSPDSIQLRLAEKYANDNSCVIVARLADNSKDIRRNDFNGSTFVLQCENNDLRIILFDKSIQSYIETQSCRN